jgi:hypothetical protein
LKGAEEREDPFIQEVYRKIESFVAQLDSARREVSRLRALLESAITIWEDETGQKIPEELRSRVDIFGPSVPRRRRKTKSN